jgi:hypothetical protein
LRVFSAAVAQVLTPRKFVKSEKSGLGTIDSENQPGFPGTRRKLLLAATTAVF